MKNITLICICALLLNNCNQLVSPDQQPPTPNVLIILTDDQGWGDLGTHGNKVIRTPVLDQLAQNSIQFSRFYVSPVCAPTRASLLTGRYHLRTGTTWVTHRKEVMNAAETTIAEIFKRAGYATGCFGKWHNGSQYPNDPNGQGFSTFFGFSAGHWNNYFDTHLQYNNQEVASKGFISDVLTDSACAFINRHTDEPFLCYLPYNAPHSPFQAPDDLFEYYRSQGLSDKDAAVYAMVENIDRNVGRVLDCLKKNKLEKETIVVFLTDNGPNGIRYNGGMKGIKASVDEGGVRVPCFISWSETLIPRQVDEIAGHIDILPTLANLCKVPIPSEVELDGLSLLPLLKEDQPDWSQRSFFHAFVGETDNAWPGAIRAEEHVMTLDSEGKEALYNLKEDPAQEQDIKKLYPEILAQLREQYMCWFAEVTKGGKMPPPIPVGYPECAASILPAPEAILKGNVAFAGGRGWANDYIINWKDTSDQVVWPIAVQSAGIYQIEVLLAADEAATGIGLAIANNTKSQHTSIQDTWFPDFVNSPDLVPRGEVYERKRKWISAGNMPFTKSDTTLSLGLRGINRGKLEIEAVKLTLLD